MRRVDYDHLHNEIMTAVQIVSESAKTEDIAEAYGELIDFLETMYVNSVLSLTGALLAVSKYTDNPDVMIEGLRAAREILEAPKTVMQAKLMDRYRELIDQLNLPDAFQTQTNNEKVSEEIQAEINLSQTMPEDSQ